LTTSNICVTWDRVQKLAGHGTLNVDDSNVTMDVLLKSIAGRNIPEGFILTEEGRISSNTVLRGWTRTMLQ